MDFIGPLPPGDSVLVAMDNSSRYYEIPAMKTTTSEKTIEVLREIFARHGHPISVYIDKGRQFTSNAFAEYMQSMGIEHYRSPPLWPPEWLSREEDENRASGTRGLVIRVTYLPGRVPQYPTFRDWGKPCEATVWKGDADQTTIIDGSSSWSRSTRPGFWKQRSFKTVCWLEARN